MSGRFSIHMERGRVVKLLLALAALLIAAGSLIVSQALIGDLKREEQSRMEVWAEAMRSLIRADETTDLNLVLRIINGNHTIPVILLDEAGGVTEHRNVQLDEGADTLAVLQEEAAAMQRAGRTMTLQLDNGHMTLCYDESVMLKRLAVYPYIQLGVVALFIALAIYALFSSMRSEQNKVWVGLSRETAHQLGTPISSLMAWTEVLRETYPDDPSMTDLQQDVERLQLIADRFSKIGSAPSLEPTDVGEAVAQAVAYMGRRTSDKVHISVVAADEPAVVRLNTPLFAWVIENLCKNAVDAMSGVGSITLTIAREARHVVIDVTDTGRGIPKSRFKSVFRPGYTTKKRGWGLGLSLAKRIVEQYHGGTIAVKQSEPGRGTTFCITLPAVAE